MSKIDTIHCSLGPLNASARRCDWDLAYPVVLAVECPMRPRVTTARATTLAVAMEEDNVEPTSDAHNISTCLF